MCPSATSLPPERRLRAGIVGGGRGAFIGAVHRCAAELDGQALVVAGAMSSRAENARASAAAWFLERAYTSYEEMARVESADANGIDFVIIATPNHLHYPVARTFLGADIHVICDKPLALTVEEGEELVRLVEAGTTLFALTHNYTGYPAVCEARALVSGGQLGEIRKVLVEYTQDWLMEPLERDGHKQAEWRTDPARAGLAGAVGDIGTHAANLLEFVTTRRIEAVCADLTSFVAGRRLDDDANMLVRLEGGAKGTLTCSQIACGEENRLTLRVYGTRAGLEWHQQEPNTLIFKPAGKPWELRRTGQGYLSASAQAATRTPAGHPEGYLEAFANIYRGFIEDVRRVGRGQPPVRDYPGVEEGLRGLRFIAQAVASSRAGSVWMRL
ncbi:MAG TPA: Gfo/Idh/MocA family oxidoreductase [Steroidobacteraceae bacterium]|jgi:predicted dehydrogenase|nr:Gfo/Idh/MocA family oxidoreductase [Steroidobacteraceae bacterium]